MELNKLLLLLVEDDEVDRMACIKAISHLVSNIKEARTGDEALSFLESEVFDCIILDYVLPDFDGLALIKEIRKRGYKVPIVVTTGHGDEMLAVEMMKAGAQDYLPKDKVKELLVKTIANAIDLYKIVLEREYYENFYNDAPVGFFTADLESGKFIKTNPELLRILEAQNIEDLPLAPALYTHPKLRTNILETLKKQHFVREQEIEITTCKGNRKYLSMTAKLCRGDGKSKCFKCLANCPRCICIEGSVTDITAQKKLELELQEWRNKEIISLQEIQAAINKRLDDFRD